MNAVIYARYSSDNQREESIEGQLRECKEYAERNGMNVVATYIDRALSAKTDDRPQFQQMIRDSNTHKFEAVLVWKLDRFSRNRYDSANYKRKLAQNHVRVVSATEPISNTPEAVSYTHLEKVYCHLKFNKNQSANITYIDFNTKAHVFLNSDISSTYSNSTDPSWLPFGAVSLFWNNDKLYCVTPSNVSADALSTQIVQMDANGTNSKPLVSIPSNQSMLRGIATDGDNLYTTLETVKENGEAYFSFSKISLSDGTITELLQLDTTDVLFGVYKDKCYFKSLKNDTESIPGEWELYSYSLSSGEKHIVARETPYSSIGGISGKFYYYLNLEQGKLFSLDLETGELSTVADNLDLGTTPETSRFYGFWDNHFMYINFITNDDYSLSYDVYGIDLESHAITTFSYTHLDVYKRQGRSSGAGIGKYSCEQME